MWTLYSPMCCSLYHRGWIHLLKYIPGNLKCSTSRWVMLTLEVKRIKMGEWRRKGKGQPESILKKKETPSYIASELWTMCLVAMEITYLLASWTDKHDSIPRFPVAKKNIIIPYVVNHLYNLYGTHWCRLQCLISWPFWLWIMSVTWLYLPLTFSRLDLRNLQMCSWAVHLRYIRFSQKSVSILG